jgi:hypothetical protein
MYDGYTRLEGDIPVLVIAAIALLVLSVNYTQTISAQQKLTDSIRMTVNLQTHENEILSNQGYFQVNTLDMNATKGSKLCPSGDCQYSIENADFSPNTISGGMYFRDC